MSTFDETIAVYRTRVGQLLDAKRMYERKAEEVGHEAALVGARIQGLMEAKELLGDQVTKFEALRDRYRRS